MQTHPNNYMRVSKNTGSGYRKTSHFGLQFYASLLSNRLSFFCQFVASFANQTVVRKATFSFV